MQFFFLEFFVTVISWRARCISQNLHAHIIHSQHIMHSSAKVTKKEKKTEDMHIIKLQKCQHKFESFLTAHAHSHYGLISI